jgi:recombination protein RecA
LAEAAKKPGITAVVNAINKKYGKGSIAPASKARALDISRIELDSLGLTAELGGGVPENRVILIVGGYSSAKTYLATKIVKGTLKKYRKETSKVVLWIDAEGAFTKEWTMTLLGEEADLIDRIYVVHPETAQQALDITDAVIRSGDCVMVVVDSIEALVPKEEVESSFEDQQVGIKARLMNKFFRKALNATGVEDLTEDNPAKCTLVMINQPRESIGYYQSESIPGGRGQGFAASVIIKLRRGDWKVEKIDGREEVVGQEVKVMIDKNKTFAPRRQCTIDIYTKDCKELPFRAGDIDRLKEVMQYAIYYNIITREGAYYRIEGVEENFHGGERLLEFLRTNEEARLMVERRVMAVVTRGEEGEEEC